MTGTQNHGSIQQCVLISYSWELQQVWLEMLKGPSDLPEQKEKRKITVYSLAQNLQNCPVQECIFPFFM